MVYTLIDHEMTSKNVQNSSGTTNRRRVVSLPSFGLFMASFYDGVTIENCCRFVFYNNMEKVRAELAIFFVEKARALHLTSFLLSVLL